MAHRKVVVYIGISLDGYIATKDDSLEWLLNTPGCGDNGFGAFYDTVDTVIMGKRTLDWILKQENGQLPYADKECYVYTSKESGQIGHIQCTSQPPAELLKSLNKEGKKIWIVGGSRIIDLFRKENLIDEYILNIAPVILGDGIPLFCAGEQIDLVLDGVKIFGQFTEVTYRVSKP